MLNDRANGYLRVREQFLDRIGQQVGGGVANNFQAIRVFGRDDGQSTVSGHLKAGVDDFAVHLASQGGLGQTSADRGGNFGHSDRTGEFAFRTVGKRDVDHGEWRKRVNQKGKKRGDVRALL